MLVASKHNSFETSVEAQFKEKEVESDVKGPHKKTVGWTVGRSDGWVGCTVERWAVQLLQTGPQEGTASESFFLFTKVTVCRHLCYTRNSSPPCCCRLFNVLFYRFHWFLALGKWKRYYERFCVQLGTRVYVYIYIYIYIISNNYT